VKRRLPAKCWQALLYCLQKYHEGRNFMNLNKWLLGAVSGLLLLGLASAEEDKKTRVGTCTDAKKQQEYFCDMKNAATDSMVALGTACRNAKINVKEACEGVVIPDPQYKSCAMEQKC
jgi:hypothetical protein